MAKWGLSLWGLGSPWGGPSTPGPDKYCALADERVLAQMDDTPTTRNFRDFICELAKNFGTFEDVAIDVGEAFDVDVAQGVQLDAIGAVVGLPRQGFGDIRYRTFLNIQIDLLLSAVRDAANWTGTHENILSICRTFVGAGPTIVLTNFPPYFFSLSVPGVTVSELLILANFVCKAIYAGVLGEILTTVDSDSLWDSINAGPIPDGGIWCSAHVPVTPCSKWGIAVAIGTQPCE